MKKLMTVLLAGSATIAIAAAAHAADRAPSSGTSNQGADADRKSVV